MVDFVGELEGGVGEGGIDFEAEALLAVGGERFPFFDGDLLFDGFHFFDIKIAFVAFVEELTLEVGFEFRVHRPFRPPFHHFYSYYQYKIYSIHPKMYPRNPPNYSSYTSLVKWSA